MTATKPIPVRFPEDDGAERINWTTVLSLYCAAASDRDPAATRTLRDIFGADALDADLRAEAEGLFTLDGDGMTVRSGSGPADVVFYPKDDGHLVDLPDARLVFKRSFDPVNARDALYPAFPRKQTLDLTSPPLRFAEIPVVSFCGQANRPDARIALLDRFAIAPGLVFACIRRNRFAHPDAGTYVANLRASHLVLCPPGAGRFSYRFYEALAAGRVPIVSFASHEVPRGVLKDATVLWTDDPAEVCAFWRRMTPERWAETHRRNRAAWFHHASPYGALRQVARTIRERFELP